MADDYMDWLPNCPNCGGERWAGHPHSCTEGKQRVEAKRIVADDLLFRSEVIEELKRARTKFPSSSLSLAALIEEVGELAQAMLKEREARGCEDHEKKRQAIWSEALQVAAMAQRVAVEGDPSFDIDKESAA